MFPTIKKDIELPLLRELILRGGSARPMDHNKEGRTVYDAVGDAFDLTKAEREEEFLDEGKPRSRWKNMVRWARQHLKDRDLLDSPQRGVWEVTPSGRAYAARHGA